MMKFFTSMCVCTSLAVVNTLPLPVDVLGSLCQFGPGEEDVIWMLPILFKHSSSST